MPVVRDEDISVNGIVMDGVLHVPDCQTRHGPYPYCREMRHGVFSVTKSLGAAVALLRLAQKYGDAGLAEKLTAHLPAGLAHAGWNGVTFADALNMATGIGDERPEREPNDPFADENKPKLTRWVGKPTAKEKLEIALGYGTYPWGRGAVLRYNSTQTFVLAAAMDTYLKRREGPNAHLWDLVRREVLRPIGILHAAGDAHARDRRQPRCPATFRRAAATYSRGPRWRTTTSSSAGCWPATSPRSAS